MNYQYSIFLKILQIPFANFQSISPCLLSYFLSFSFYICFSLDAKLECSFSFWVCLCIFPPRSFIWRKRGKKSCKKKGKEERFWATQGQTPKPGLLACSLAQNALFLCTKVERWKWSKLAPRKKIHIWSLFWNPFITLIELKLLSKFLIIYVDFFKYMFSLDSVPQLSEHFS